MLVKHRPLETSYKGALRARICNMVKAGLLELQFPCPNPPGITQTGCSVIREAYPLICRCNGYTEALSQRVVKLVKGTNGEPKLHENALRILNVDSLSWEACKGYEVETSENPIWLRSLRSSPRMGKPSTWRRETGHSRTKGLRRYA
jgi:hypothetical protein